MRRKWGLVADTRKLSLPCQLLSGRLCECKDYNLASYSSEGHRGPKLPYFRVPNVICSICGVRQITLNKPKIIENKVVAAVFLLF
jgi:hypothetical protein